MGKVSSPAAFIRLNPFQSALKSVGMAVDRVTGGGDVSRLGGDPLAVLVLEFDLLELLLVAVAGVDVADGPLVRGEETGHAAGTLNLVDVSRPADGRSGPERPGVGAIGRGGARHEVEVLGGEAGGGGPRSAGRNLDRRVRGDAQGWG